MGVEKIINGSLDPKTIQYLKEISDDSNPDFFRELVAIFLKQTPSLILELQAQVAEENHEAIEQTAHRLKGSALNLGAKELASIFSEMETKGKEGVSEGLPKMSEQLDTLFNSAREALMNEI